MNKKEQIFSTDHVEIIAGAWDSMGAEQQLMLCQSVAEGLLKNHPDRELPFAEVIKASWCLGFHYCMLALEQGALVKAGPVKPEQN